MNVYLYLDFVLAMVKDAMLTFGRVQLEVYHE